MRRLRDFLEEQLETLGWNQKRLAHEWQRELGERSVATLEGQVSRLLSGDAAGYDFLFNGAPGTHARIESLARALKGDANEIRALAEADRARRTLILDPLLRDRERDFVLLRARDPDAKFEVESLEPRPDPSQRREALRDGARRRQNPVVVIADEADAPFFEGAGISASRVLERKDGFVIERFADLTPPLEPQLFDEDGMPMIAAPGLEHRDGSAETLARIHEARSRGAPPTFRLDRVFGPLNRSELLRSILGRAATALQIPGSWRAENHIWGHAKRVFTVCAGDDRRLETVRRFHDSVVAEPRTLAALVDGIRSAYRELNPHREGGDVGLDAELRDFREETGIDLPLDARAVRGLRERGTPERIEPRAKRVFRSAEADAMFRREIDALLGREIVLGSADVSVLFVLEAARDAPLWHLDVEGLSHCVLANMGAGRLLRVEMRRYRREKPVALTRLEPHGDRSCLLDGGDVSVDLVTSFDDRLEGTTPRSVRRRREKADAAARAAIDD